MRENVDCEGISNISHEVNEYVDNTWKLKDVNEQVQRYKLENNVKIQDLKSELFDQNRVSVEFLKNIVVEPIEGSENMQVLEESEALKQIILNLFDISNEKCSNWAWETELMPWVNWLKVKNILNDIVNGNNGVSATIRKYLYQLLSDNSELYEQLLNRIWWPFILWANDRWNRWSNESWGVHMWVDYNLPVWVPVQSIYDGVILWWVRDGKPFWDGKILEQFSTVKKDGDAWYWNMLIIKHEVGWKVFYSLYGHITNDGFQEWKIIKKGEKIWKLAPYESNWHWQPHLHFTIMHNLDNKNVLHWYWNSEDLSDMVNPLEIFH